MPPKQTRKPVKPTATSSASKPTSRDLVPVGPKHVSTNAPGHLSARVGKNQSKRNENGEKPTTSRALVLRNGKYGARGTGELMLVSKLTGREKLDLLAEDLINQSKKDPFSLAKCQKIASSQCSVFLDDITNLRDPELFQHLIQAELSARTQRDLENKNGDPLRNPSYVASTIANKIHNAYLLASAWNIVSETLRELAQEGLAETEIRSQLRNDASLRSRYLVLYDMVTELVNLSQARFSLLATTTPHYSRYFRLAEGSDPGERDIIFDWAALREACISFLDSIVIELCFPRAPYPKVVLYQILRDAVAESPKEAKRFPQALWDAVGDLSVSVQLQQLLGAPLLGSEGDAWKSSPRTTMPESYDTWIDAQFDSEEAAGKYANFKDFIFPLDKTKDKFVLENMWNYQTTEIQLPTIKNYKAVSGKDIDSLWGLTGALDPSPQWHSYYVPNMKQDSDYDSDDPPRLAPFSRGKKRGSKHLAIANGPADDSSDSMPELQSASNSSEEVETEDDSDSDDDDPDDKDSEDSGYDTEQEDEMREMLREAMDTAHEADWLHSANVPSGIDPFLQDRKGNPFLKLLGSLRGRMFSSNPKLKIRKHPASEPSAAPLKTKIAADAPKMYKATVEDVADEDEVPRAPKKKKKRPKKKKKATELQQGAPVAETGQAPAGEATPVPVVKVQSPPVVPPKTVAATPISPQKAGSTRLAPSTMSTTSLGLGSAAAQSARSYLQSENLDTQRTKIKTRPDYATSFMGGTGKKGVLSKIMGRNKTREEETKATEHSWFSKLTKKTAVYMHQLLNTTEDDAKGIAPMKWDHFVKVMQGMGFVYDPSTAGSSVRFDPPDPRDKPITFHKPHPDPTLQPIKIKEFAKRLKRRYGWTGEEFIKHAS